MASKLEAALSKYLGNNLELRAGILEGSTYEDGTSVAQIGYIQEYGATINQPARMGTIYRRIRKDGTLSSGGRFVKAKSSNFATDHNIPAHTINIPPRPFFRTVVANGRATWPAILAQSIERHGSVRKGMESLGRAIKNELEVSVLTWETPPNAKSTIAKKKSASPLVETGKLHHSFDFEVNDD
ncbi:hypothetical protein AB7250_07755 [Providencia stuartii]|uniref:hypothetical protein n=1 Tax=Providencia TaxID=586 RepID=UPI0013A7436E|nr:MULTISPECIES: hypothetical protein [Providencia]MBQ0456057.1 hypothetical protein [Providencia stuartii]MDN7224017.1 hypothetical protein [Providencia stuartii]QIB29869.1 hypothetical protein G3A48_09040 [Providencia stuartii]QPN42180.1 hypothetical protein I3B46_08820 [Providencia sp. 2.29]WAZ77110.1 hypothetical protein O4001_12665 [Providencia stuartii]